jgi:hypothetical protein
VVLVAEILEVRQRPDLAAVLDRLAVVDVGRDLIAALELAQRLDRRPWTRSMARWYTASAKNCGPTARSHGNREPASRQQPRLRARPWVFVALAQER